MKIAHKIETYTSDGEPVLRFTVMNSSGVYMEFTNWGARWITASVPDVQGALDNVLIGYDSLAGYLEDSYYMGATIGRFANRIYGAQNETYIEGWEKKTSNLLIYKRLCNV